MYIVMELKTNGSQTEHIYSEADNIDHAMNKYHTVLAEAAISEVECHACVVLDEEGKYIARDCYKHTRPVNAKLEETENETA